MEKLDIQIILIILSVNIAVALLVAIVALFKSKKKRSTYYLLSLFIVSTPGFGLLYIALGIALYAYRKNIKVDMGDISFGRQREELLISADKSVELNYVPVEDAMAVSDTNSLRNLLLDIMLKRGSKSLSSIYSATKSQDSESSHYAASLIMEALSIARINIQNLVDRLNDNPEDVNLNLKVFQYIHETLNLKIMNNVEHQTHTYFLNDISQILYQRNIWYMTGSHYLKLIDWLIDIKDYDLAFKWLTRAKNHRPNALEIYKASLHLYYVQNNRGAFLDTLEEARKSDVLADKEMLDLFRLYDTENREEEV